MATITPGLSELQREVLARLAKKQHPSFIAASLWKSESTIRYHMKVIRSYFGVTTTDAAIAKAREWDVIGEAS